MKRSEVSLIDRVVMLHVWIHSNAETGKPDSIDVFEIAGKVHMRWYAEALEDNNGSDLADAFYEHLQKVDDSGWFLVAMETETETAVEPPEHYARVVALIT